MDVNLLKEINLSDYKQMVTSKRFNKISGKFVPVKSESPVYESAQFGEMILHYQKPGVHRLQKITIIFARLMSLE